MPHAASRRSLLLLLCWLGAGCPSQDSPPDACPALSARPGPRVSAAAAFVHSRSALILFGGQSAALDLRSTTPTQPLDEVWSFTSSPCPSFTRLQPKTGPSPRTGHAMAYDPLRDRVLVVGGRRVGDAPLTIDVWALTLDPPAWTQLQTAGTAPAPRQSHSLIYDAGRDRLVLFGGNTGPAYFDSTSNELFELAFASRPGGTWLALAAPGGPSPRQDSAVAVDLRRGRMLLFGGAFDYTRYTSELWALDLKGNSWSLLTPITGAPSARFGATAAYDEAGDRLVLLGGRDASALGERNDTWDFRPSPTDPKAGDFRLLLSGDTSLGVPGVDHKSPERRFLGAAAVGAGQLWLLGGQSRCGALDDLWALDLVPGGWSALLRPQSGETCARRAAPNQGCPADCTAPL